MNEFRTVIAAEIRRRVRSRAFKIGLLVGIVGVAFAIKAPQLLGGALNHASHSIVVGGPPPIVDRAAKLLSRDFQIDGVTTQTLAPAANVLKAHPNAGAFLAVRQAGHGIAVTVYARDLSFVSAETIKRDLMPLNLAMRTAMSESAINRGMDVPISVRGFNSKFTSSGAADAAKGLAYALLIFLYVSILLNSQLIMTSVAEEKTSRIAELLVASVHPSALLAGKIAAAAVLAVIQMGSWLAVAYFVGGFGGGFALTEMVKIISPIEALAFAGYFIVGYLQLSTLFAAAASLVNRTEDLGSLSGPLVLPVVIALFIGIYALGFPNAPLAVIASFIPIVAPFAMFARIAVGIVPAWQIALSIAINLAAGWAFAVLAGRIYRVGMLLYGRPPKLTQLWSTLRT
ncbi:MAG: ABC transporter permease [Candidatus Eremiobacteraeota bacterium]|nr:ABC transporter permease [Candidatus Eremiobacteraeota bacterium]